MQECLRHPTLENWNNQTTMQLECRIPNGPFSPVVDRPKPQEAGFCQNKEELDIFSLLDPLCHSGQARHCRSRSRHFLTTARLVLGYPIVGTENRPEPPVLLFRDPARTDQQRN
ncbi:hypothetical protein KSP39_PZI007001 [Platanthera zijinensis]|uniref:Uncharacterized protein n=1 Tax=Platanthera zijinensis TaxID=2320716 RepID=A0AAP0BQK3_9ASPA